MNPPAKLGDLIEVLEFDIPTHITLFDRQTGRVVSVDRDVMNGVEEGDEERLNGLPDCRRMKWRLPGPSAMTTVSALLMLRTSLISTSIITWSVSLRH